MNLFHPISCSLNTFFFAVVVEFVLRVDFDGYSLFCFFVLCKFNLSISSWSEKSNYLVLTKLLYCLLLQIVFADLLFLFIEFQLFNFEICLLRVITWKVWVIIKSNLFKIVEDIWNFFLKHLIFFFLFKSPFGCYLSS